MKKTLIISAFPGCGKTFLYRNQDKIPVKFNGIDIRCTFCDSDSSKFSKHNGWEKEYVDSIEDKIGILDFIFISQHDLVLAELERRNIPFISVAPDNSLDLSIKARSLIRQDWFNRLIYRDNSHIKDYASWINLIKTKYDEWTSDEALNKYHPVEVIKLGYHQYISDIIDRLYYDKETCSKYTLEK